jgi:hypothetical protein
MLKKIGMGWDFYLLFKMMNPTNQIKTKAPQNRGNTRNKNGRTHIQKDKKSTYEGESQGENQVPEPLHSENYIK